MATISAHKQNAAMQLKYSKGQNLNGTPKMVNQKIYVNREATDEKIYELGMLMEKLLVSELITVDKIETSALIID